jgi:hypothetical protein
MPRRNAPHADARSVLIDPFNLSASIHSVAADDCWLRLCSLIRYVHFSKLRLFNGPSITFSDVAYAYPDY